MTVTELRERLDACDSDDLIQMHVSFDGKDYYRFVEGITSCNIDAVTFLDGGKAR